MKHLINLQTILSLIFFINIYDLNAQTYISGFINSNTTWNISGSPYIVTGNTLVSAGNTLIIEPGVIVKFDTLKALQIDGELIAIGTPLNRISFTSNKANPQPGDWAKIHFSDYCTDAIYDTNGIYISGSIMKYCDIHYAGGLGYGAIHIEKSTPYFNNCLINQSASSGIFNNGFYIAVDYCNIMNCELKGIIQYNISDQTIRNLIISNNTFINNHDGALYIYGASNYNSKSYIIKNSFISNNSIYNEIVDINVGNNIFHLDENIFINNDGNIILGLGGYASANVQCNKFINNNAATEVISINNPSLNFSNNLIENNLCEHYRLIRIIASSPYQTSISNNYILNNICANGTILSAHVINNTNSSLMFKIHNNYFVNNISQKVLETNNGGTYNINSYFIKYNGFVNPLSDYELYNSIPYGSTNLFVDSNYWGSTSTQHIDSVIYDYFDFANMSVVYYLPILTQPIIFDTTSCPFSIIMSEPITELKTNTSIFPNPASDYLTIKSSNNNQETEITIFSLLGNLEYYELTKDDEHIIDISGLNNGIHIIKVVSSGTIFQQKFVKY